MGFKDYLRESRRSDDFFGDSKHGKALAKLFGNKADREKFDKYLDTVQPNDDVKYARAIDFMLNGIGLDTKQYNTIAKSEDALWKKVESLYKEYK